MSYKNRTKSIRKEIENLRREYKAKVLKPERKDVKPAFHLIDQARKNNLLHEFNLFIADYIPGLVMFAYRIASFNCYSMTDGQKVVNLFRVNANKDCFHNFSNYRLATDKPIPEEWKELIKRSS